MGCKRIFLIFCILLLSFKAFPAIFTVTSNADSGPGTLRDALTQAAANGNATTDYIYFNLPDLSVTGRTITLLSNLPAITSDVVIDGSTQPGAPLSLNGAGVIIGGSYQVSNSYIAFFLIQNVNNAEIDGLIIKSFFPEPYDVYNGVAAIIIAGNNNTIAFGQPGKGNVIYSCSQAIQSEAGASPWFPDKSSTQNIIFKNNLIGVKEDGITTDGAAAFTAGTGPSEVILNYVYNATLGGDTKAEGNVFYAITSLSPSYLFDTFSQNVNYKIRNNIFGANTLQQAPYPSPNFLSLGVDPNLTYDHSTTISITDNVFGHNVTVHGFQLLNLQIQRNFFGVSSDLNNKLPMNGSAITLSYLQGTILIGGSDISFENIFTNSAQSNDPTVNDVGVVQVSTFSPTTGLDPLFKVELSHNSFYCNNGPPFLYNLPYNKKPLSVTVDNLTATSASGKTAPNARVELFYTDKECTQCQPKTFITSTNADANGNWVYNTNFQTGYGVMAGATLNQTSSEFTDTRIYAVAPYITVIYPECGNNGRVDGAIVVNWKNIQWLDSNNQVVGTTPNLDNIGPGTYTLRAEQFGCVMYSKPVFVYDATPVIDPKYMTVIQPACNKNGSITGITATNTSNIQWLDGSGNIIGNGYDITGLSPGSYTLQITGQRGCVKTYGPILLQSVQGLTVDQAQVKIVGSNCKPDGSVTNLKVTGTGTIKYSWKNSQQQEIATTQDLIGQLPGVYSVQISDDSQCDPVVLTFEIPNLSGVEMDYSKAKVTMGTCGEANGSITGIIETGATKLTWVNSSGVTVGSKADLTNVPGGDYQLTIANDCGNTLKTPVFHIDQGNATVYPNYTASVTDICSGSSYGSINVATDGLVKSARWVDSQGNTVGNNIDLNNVPAGTYQLYLTDQNGCELFYKQYVVDQIPAMQLEIASVLNDQCSSGVGSITGAAVSGGKQPYNYSWTDKDGNVISTAAEISGLFPGDYTLTVTDASGCNSLVAHYSVHDQQVVLPAPSVDNVQVCSPGDALVIINDPVQGYSYRLYASENSSSPVAESDNGKLAFTARINTTLYVTAFRGACESPRVKVQVAVGVSTLNIPNAFTPNGDGINDYWLLPGIQNYPNALVQIFTRYGQQVYESRGYAHPFDGTMNGKPLPVGVYYYIINLGSNCNLITGNITLIR